jgi:hypothetical protein
MEWKGAIIMLTNLKNSAPILQNPLDWACILAIVVILFCVAVLLPKNKVWRAFEGIVLPAAVLAFIVGPIIRTDMFPNAKKIVFSSGTSLYIVIAIAVIYLYGTFANNAYLTQAIYGICLTVTLPVSLMRLLLPTWLTVSTFTDLINTPRMLWKLIIFSLMFFMSIRLVTSGRYKIGFNTLWHMLYGISIIGCVMLFVAEAKLKNATGSMKQLVTLLGADGINMNSVKNLGLLCAIGVALVFVVCLISVSVRRALYGEKIITSETKGAFMIRLIGHLIAVAIPAASIVFLPSLLHANTWENRTGMPTAILFLVPIILMLVVMFFTTYWAENSEIKAAKAAYEKAYPAN